jgi:hypothetical protein
MKPNDDGFSICAPFALVNPGTAWYNGTKHKAQSTKHKAQSTKHKAQSTKHKAQIVI